MYNVYMNYIFRNVPIGKMKSEM